MTFIHDDFLLRGGNARKLYREYAERQPILDFHCHLPPGDIAGDRRFENLFEIWLEGDHYKWRAMRANGEEERLCTGDASPFEKFLAWARTVPHTLRNPLYHWTHLELKRYFGIDDLLSEATAHSIWNRANEALASGSFSVHGILRKFRVKALCTTDDPVDDLRYHRQIQAGGLETRVFPTFRPDNAFAVDKPASFNRWLSRLEAAANLEISRLGALLDALRSRHDEFHRVGCRLSDHGLDVCGADICTEREAEAVFENARRGRAASPVEQRQFTSFLLLFLSRLDTEKGWTKQLHVGARRDNNSRMFERLGPNTGFDSIGDWNQVDGLAGLLDRLDRENALPRMILYNLNPADNYAFAALAGCFQNGSRSGGVRFGSAWWFLDQSEGIRWQLEALSNVGLLSRFPGMVTDSRSFMSYPRHEYFRRVLSNLIGDDVDHGRLPDEPALLGPLMEAICYGNAAQWLALPL